ncbi:RRP6-like 2-like protein [Drosera capensis]
MELDESSSPLNSQTLEHNLQTLRYLTSSLSKLSTSSRLIPSDKDFHFYYNFNEFRAPIDRIAAGADFMLGRIGSMKEVLDKVGENLNDVEDGLEWLGGGNDEVLERFDTAVDEWKRVRKAEEEGVGGRVIDEDGFELVCGKKKKKGGGVKGGGGGEEGSVGGEGVRVVEKDKRAGRGMTKAKVPFHIPSIRRPQDEFNILVNNSNQPFQHVWLQSSEDGSRFIHPLEKLSVLDFIQTVNESNEPVKPLPIESTPFKLIEEVKDLKQLAIKLHSVNEFAVDLEHNQYRSFQGLTCLMQISTRTEDFIIDTLKLRVHVGPYLREVFKDPSKRKVMHGADKDIVWLQRDFGIYVCNMFDTGQASRVLKMERNSLEYLLHHICGVAANKEYQNADWRLRPLPEDMLRYARDDTHYLLFIYDVLRARLLSEPPDSEDSDAPLVEVYKRSYNICMQLYEKELLTDASYLHIYGLERADLSAQKLSVVAGLHQWRDNVARMEDESTGYVLPNKTLLEIAKQMPGTTSKLKKVVKSKLPYVERNLGSIVSIIRHSIQTAAEFQAVVEQLKEARDAMASEAATAELENFEVLPQSETSVTSTASGKHGNMPASSGSDLQARNQENHEVIPGENGPAVVFPIVGRGVLTHGETSGDIPKNVTQNFPETHKSGDISTSGSSQQEKVATVPTIPVLKKPSRAFAAFLGKPAPKQKTPIMKERNDRLVEQIKSSVKLPFLSFSGPPGLEENLDISPSSTKQETMSVVEDNADAEGSVGVRASTSEAEDIIMIENSDSDIHGDESAADAAEDPEGAKDNEADTDSADDASGEPSLSGLSSGLQKCFQSMDQKRNEKHNKSVPVQIAPFDYDTARKQVIFGVEEETGKANSGVDGSLRRKGGYPGKTPDTEAKLAAGKRRQAFPASGNRSATFL